MHRRLKGKAGKELRRAVGVIDYRARMQDFKKLRVWHAAVRLSLSVVDALPEQRARRIPGLRSQAIRAGMSVHANLVEGCARATRMELLHFVEISTASLKELEAHMIVARDGRIIAVDLHRDLQSGVILVRRMLLSFQNTLQRRIAEEQADRLRRRRRHMRRIGDVVVQDRPNAVL